MKIMLKFCQPVIVLSFFITFTGCTTTDPKPSESSCGPNIIPNDSRTSRLVKTVTETYDLLKKDGKNVLFIDVRTCGEASQGMPTPVDANVPIFEQKKELVFNNNFVATVEEHLEEKKLNKQNTILLICRWGDRSKRAVDTLVDAGYKNVYHVVGGVDRWKNNHLPWSNADEIDIEILYFGN